MKLTLTTIATVCTVWALSPASAQDQNPPVPDRQPGSPAPGTREGDTTPGNDEKPGRESTPAPRTDHEAAPAPANETDFVTTAAKSGMGEVKLAELGVKQAQDDKVKELAEMLVKDHTKANEELKAAATSANIKVSELPDPKAEQKYADLSKRSGAEFDKAFLEEMAMCHEKSIALFESGKKVSKAEPVTEFIGKTLPVIQGHARQIKALQTAERAGATPRTPGTTPGKIDESGTTPRPGTNPRPGTDPAPDRTPTPRPEKK